jgi:hypothetical protein
MEVFFLLIAIVCVFGICVLLPLLIRYLDGHDNRLKLFLLIPVVFIGITIYTAIYPSEDFYKEDFKEITGLDFPQAGSIVFKSASYPDQFGDYGSVSIVRISKEFLFELEGQLRDKGFKKTFERNGSNELDRALKEIGNREIEKEFSVEYERGIYYYVAFLSDKETIIVNRQSW